MGYAIHFVHKRKLTAQENYTFPGTKTQEEISPGHYKDSILCNKTPLNTFLIDRTLHWKGFCLKHT